MIKIDHPPCYMNRTCRPIFISNQVPVEWAVPMYGYIMPFIVTVTVATNGFIVVVLSHKYLRTPTNYVLLAMAVFELLTGLSCMPWFAYYYTLSGYKTDLKYGLPSYWCAAIPYLAAYLPSIFHTMAIWLTVYLAIQRYIYICIPSLVRKLCTIYRSKQVIFFICLISITMNMPELFSSRNETHFIYDRTNNQTHRVCYRYKTALVQFIGENIYYNATFCAQTIFVHLIPCVLLVIFTWRLVSAIRLADRRHATLLSKYPSNSRRSTRRKFSELTSSSENENRIVRLFKMRESLSEPRRAHGLKQNTRMLIVVILLFLITEIPAALIYMVHVISVSLRLSIVDYQLLNILLIVRNVLIVVSYPFRFAIYCGMSQQFRDVVRQMFTGKVLSPVIRDKDNSTTLALVHGTNDHSDDKRHSVLFASTNGTMLAAARDQDKYKNKNIQCDLTSFDESEAPLFALDISAHTSPVTGHNMKSNSCLRNVKTQFNSRIEKKLCLQNQNSLLHSALQANTQVTTAIAQVL